MFKNKIKTSYIGLKLQTSYEFNNNNSLNLGLDFLNLMAVEFKNELSGTIGNENIIISEVPGEFYKEKGIILLPEIYMETTLFRGLNLTYGAKMRFWGNKTKNFYGLSYKYYDYQVIDYQLSSRNFGLFVGLNYQFQLPKKK